MNRYRRWDDARLLSTFSDPQYEGKLSHHLFSGLATRHLWKLAFKEDIQKFRADARQTLKYISRPENRSIRAKLEAGIAEVLRTHATCSAFSTSNLNLYVIGHSYTLKSVKEQSRNDEASILIEDTPPKLFEAASTLFSSIDEKLNETSFEVYAPIAYSTAAERRSLKQKLHQPIIDVLESVATGESNANL